MSYEDSNVHFNSHHFTFAFTEGKFIRYPKRLFKNMLKVRN